MVSIVVVFLILAVIAAAIPTSARKRVGVQWPLELVKPLSKVEQVLYWRLVEALPGHVVLCQVQLSRFLRVKRTGHWSWRNRIDRKSADYVVCRPDFSLVSVVELDDATHAAAARRKADVDKDAALTAAGVSVVRWTVKAMPTKEEIQKQFAQIS